MAASGGKMDFQLKEIPLSYRYPDGDRLKLNRGARMACLPLALLLAVGTAAAEQRVICPTEIVESSIKVTNISTQWHPYIASPLYLSSAGATAGPPERLATLMGESTWKKGREDGQQPTI